MSLGLVCFRALDLLTQLKQRRTEIPNHVSSQCNRTGYSCSSFSMKCLPMNVGCRTNILPMLIPSSPAIQPPTF